MSGIASDATAVDFAALPASVLADLTGISISTAERWPQWPRRDWAVYVGQRANDDREDADSRKPA